MPPVLSRTNTQTNADARYCGAFTFTENWAVRPQSAGVILQKVTRTLTVQQRADQGGIFTNPYTMLQARNAFDPHNNTLFLDVMAYWELFDVPAVGGIHADQFQSNWFAPTSAQGQPVVNTKGTYRIVGEARFYATQRSHAELGFPGPDLAIANGLPSTTADPTANFAGITAANISNLVTRTVTASWSCETRDPVTNSYGITHLAVA